jgi:Fur family transcriptional regulator, stress-responsive regulator
LPLEDVDCVNGEAQSLRPTITGFIVDEADVTFSGTCRSCSEPIIHGAQTPSTTKENI